MVLYKLSNKNHNNGNSLLIEMTDSSSTTFTSLVRSQSDEGQRDDSKVSRCTILSVCFSARWRRFGWIYCDTLVLEITVEFSHNDIKRHVIKSSADAC